MSNRDPDGQAEAVRRILGYTRRIAVVGLSDNPMRTSHGVALSLLRHGYEIVPVNPTIDEWHGLEAFPTLADVPGEIDLVNVFRRTEHLDGIADEVVARGGVRALWLQQGLRSAHARAVATQAGIDFVEDRCSRVEVALHADLMELPPAA
ncbi:MAG: CoA-binding protein [Nitriliruptorales bacterium]|nr:CoA-binding protein [Nitriliruptorales bacterium]